MVMAAFFHIRLSIYDICQYMNQLLQFYAMSSSENNKWNPSGCPVLAR